MKVQFVKKKNQILIEDFPLFLYSEASFYKLLDILENDFFVGLSVAEEQDREESDTESPREIQKLNLSLVGKEKLDQKEAEELFKEMMTTLVSFEKGKSLLDTPSMS
jgi:predicted site-specific integrase-resolvase